MQSLTQKQVKWGLFAALVLFVPCFFYLFVIAGIVPLSFILLISFNKNLMILGMGFIHVLIYGAAFYGIAVYITKLLFCVNSVLMRQVIFICIAVGLGMVAMAQIYGTGHNSIEWKDWLGIMKDVPAWR